MMNVPKLLVLHEFKLGHSAPKLLPISTEHRDPERDPYVIGQYEGGTKSSVVER